KTDYHIELEKAMNGKKLVMEQRRDLYLIYKESLNNIYKHAEASTVWVLASVEMHRLYLVIRDDGKGFSTKQVSYRNGLKNLRWRTERWKGDFKIESGKGEGTTITVSMPL